MVTAVKANKVFPGSVVFSALATATAPTASAGTRAAATSTDRSTHPARAEVSRRARVASTTASRTSSSSGAPARAASAGSGTGPPRPRLRTRARTSDSRRLSPSTGLPGRTVAGPPAGASMTRTPRPARSRSVAAAAGSVSGPPTRNATTPGGRSSGGSTEAGPGAGRPNRVRTWAEAVTTPQPRRAATTRTRSCDTGELHRAVRIGHRCDDHTGRSVPSRSSAICDRAAAPNERPGGVFRAKRTVGAPCVVSSAVVAAPDELEAKVRRDLGGEPLEPDDFGALGVRGLQQRRRGLGSVAGRGELELDP